MKPRLCITALMWLMRPSLTVAEWSRETVMEERSCREKRLLLMSWLFIPHKWSQQFPQQSQLSDTFPLKHICRVPVIRRWEKAPALATSWKLIAHCYEEVHDSHGSCGMSSFNTRLPGTLIWFGSARGSHRWNAPPPPPPTESESLRMAADGWLMTLLREELVLCEIKSSYYLTCSVKIFFIYRLELHLNTFFIYKGIF